MTTPSKADRERRSVQQRLYPELTCFGCGPANPVGLRLESFEAEGGVSARFVPRPEHGNGVGYVNGGIIATILDCHSAAAVMSEADRRGWLPPDSGLSYVTAGIDVRYLRPTPLDETLDLWAAIAGASETEMTVDVELRWDDKPRAAAVATWKRWRPR